MAFDIRAIFNRALGGRSDRESRLPVAAPEELSDEEMPGSPILAAGSAAAAPDTDDMAQGGATTATALIPEGVGAIPSAAVDVTSSRDDDTVSDDQARLVAEVAVAASMVHGPPKGDLRRDLVESLREVPGLEDYSDDDFDETMNMLREVTDADDASDFVAALEDRLEEISTSLTDPGLRRAAYQLAVYFAAWDGLTTDEEDDMLGAVAEAFEIPSLEARSLREATMLEAGEEGELRPGPSM